MWSDMSLFIPSKLRSHFSTSFSLVFSAFPATVFSPTGFVLIFSDASSVFIASIIFLFLHFFRHIDQSEAIEHPIDVSHTPDVTQSLWSFNYFSYLFDIPQCQQHRTPRQAFALPSAVDPQFLCIFAASALSYFIGKV